MAVTELELVSGSRNSERRPATTGWSKRTGASKDSIASIVVLSLLIGIGSVTTAVAKELLGSKTSLEQQRKSGICRGFDFSGKVTDGYFVLHGGQKIKVEIPLDYLLFPETGSSFTEKSDGQANFNFHRDTLKPYPRQEMFGKIVAGKEEWISFLVTDLTEIETIAKTTMNILSGRKYASDEPPFSESKVSASLFKVQLPDWGQADWQRKTLYFARDISRVTDVISCDVAQSGNYPHCEQITRLRGYDVKISYPLDQLQNWTTAKRHVQNLLECMTD